MSASPTDYYVMIFRAVCYALKAEKIPHKLIPVPRQISSDCGICLRFEKQYRGPIEANLCNKVEFEKIHLMKNSMNDFPQKSHASEQHFS